MRTLNTCNNCSTQLRDGQKFCGACGTFIDTSEENILKVECETHPNHRAVGLCVICGKPVCSDCVVMNEGKSLCADPEHRMVLQEWCIMQQLDSEFEAGALVRNLADGGIEVKTYSLHDHIATHWLTENHVLLFVRKLEIEKAKALLKELNLVDNS
jgi:hypothetical protein